MVAEKKDPVPNQGATKVPVFRAVVGTRCADGSIAWRTNAHTTKRAIPTNLPRVRRVVGDQRGELVACIVTGSILGAHAPGITREPTAPCGAAGDNMVSRRTRPLISDGYQGPALLGPARLPALGGDKRKGRRMGALFREGGGVIRRGRDRSRARTGARSLRGR
jgi:hypothetical protein